MGDVMAEKICFVVSPINDPDTPARKRSDQVLKYIIEPAVKERGYEAIRADKISSPGLITSQVIQHVVGDALVVADLTDNYPNVFYELAIRHAFRKPYIQLMLEGQKPPFDVAPVRTIFYNIHNLDSTDAAKKEIIGQIDAIEKPGATIENPISVAVDLQSLRKSGDPQQRSLADVLSGIADLKNMLAEIVRRRVDDVTYVPSSSASRFTFWGQPILASGVVPPSTGSAYYIVPQLGLGSVSPDLEGKIPEEIRKALEAQEQRDRRNIRSEGEDKKTEPKS